MRTFLKFFDSGTKKDLETTEFLEKTKFITRHMDNFEDLKDIVKRSSEEYYKTESKGAWDEIKKWHNDLEEKATKATLGEK